MSIAIVAPGKDRSSWVEHFHNVDSSLDVQLWPDIRDFESVRCALVWKHPEGSLKKFPNLSLICSMGAGVDHIFNDTDLPDLPVTKVVDEHLTRDMSQYVIQGVLNHHRNYTKHYEAKLNGQWLDDHHPPKATVVGIMGLGSLGKDLAIKLAALGFPVHGFSYRKKIIEGISTYSQQENEIEPFVKAVNLLVCLLPLTNDSEGILNKKLFDLMNPGTYLINAARGKHLVDQDLIEAIDNGQVSGALLDVFHEEPLPETHPFWQKNEIMITPHNASITDPVSVAAQIVANYRRIGSGDTFMHLVDLERKY